MIRTRLQQHRIHRRLRSEAGGLRLQVLRAADLGAVGADAGIVGHVLGLERRNCNPTARERSA
jgi:hypothetical protein